MLSIRENEFEAVLEVESLKKERGGNYYDFISK